MKFYIIIFLLSFVFFNSQQIKEGQYCKFNKEISLNAGICINFISPNKFQEIFIADVNVLNTGIYTINNQKLILDYDKVDEENSEDKIFDIVKISDKKLILISEYKNKKRKIVLLRKKIPIKF